MKEQLCLMTPTWSGDRVHFDLLRASIERSALHSLQHYIVVQTEDMDHFRQYAGQNVELVASAELLPPEVERMRLRARRLREWCGRGATRILGSINRRAGFPRWVQFTGWHVQQITKLALAATCGYDNAAVMDSDVVVTRHARVGDFLQPGKIVCFEKWGPAAQADRKVVNWNRQAHALWGTQPEEPDIIETYFDTPFLLHTPSVCAMLDKLEAQYGRPWWRTLLAQPPRRWSEFATYRTYLRFFVPSESIEWRSDRQFRVLADASDPEMVRDMFKRFLQDPGSHYVTIYSQSSGRQLWGAEAYAPLILSLLDAV